MNDTASGEAISKHDKLMFWGCFIALITTAFAFISRMFLINTWGVQFALDDQEKGALLGAGVWPFAISIVLFSLFIDKVGYKVAMVFSFLAYLIWSVIGVAAFFVEDKDTAYQMLYWGSILLGLSNGTVEAYINPVVATMFTKNKTKWLNILHAGWPGGLVIAGLITIGLGNVDWWIKIGIIAVPALIFFIMLVPLKFPANERVAAGVSYRDMLAEFGVGGALVVAFLICLQMIEVFGTGMAIPVWIVGGLCVAGFGAYTRSFGNIFVLVMALIMIPLATTEIGTDGWITGIMEKVFEEEGPLQGLHPGWILVYTSAIMCLLRFCAGPIVHALSPIGLLIGSAILAIAGLMTLSMTAGIMIFAAATLYAFGKTFFWPTMLGVVSEQSPKGGALTLNALGGIGMLAVGVLGFPFIGVLQAGNAVDAIENDTAIVEAAPALLDSDGNLVATVDKEAYYGVLPYQDIDSDKIAEILEPLGDEKAAEVSASIAETKGASAQGALFDMAIFPGIMLVAYIGMFIYFKSKGGYAAQHLTTDEGLSPEAEAAAAAAAQE